MPTPEETAAAAKAAADATAKGAEDAAKKPLSDDQKKLVDNADAFNARLDQAKASGQKAALEALGIKSVDEGKKLLADLRAAEDAKKSEHQKLSERLTVLEPEAAKAKEYAATIASYAKTEFDALPDEAKKLVTAQAGEDSHLRLKAIGALRESGVLAKLAPEAAKPASSRAGGAPPKPSDKQAKHPRDMTPAEYKQYEKERLAVHARR